MSNFLLILVTYRKIYNGSFDLAARRKLFLDPTINAIASSLPELLISFLGDWSL